ncbi:MAG: flagellar hook-basal body protein [Chloroflexi bacterium]|nr:flagellar hook-basal body protein [Chloroflexota bacterium]
MLKGIYAAVSAMIAGANKQGLNAHNTANLNTPGFKQVFTTMQEFQKTEVFQIGKNNQSGSQESIGNLGLGVMTTETRTNFTAGALQTTNNPFDFAIQGDGFFRIMTSGGERFTRDGRFIRDANESLVTIDGNKVLDSTGNPIQIHDGEMNTRSSGGVLINGALTLQLGIAEFARPETQLQKNDGNLFQALEAPTKDINNSTIRQGYLEMSNVNIVDLLVSTKTYEAAQKMVQNQDELLGRTISTLGKLA